MACGRIKSKSDKICIGDLDKKITIVTRTKQVPQLDSVDSLIATTTFKTVWAMQVSKSGTATFDATNTDAIYTDIFYIRYLDNIDITKAIQYNSINYKIVDVEDLNGNKEFLKILTNKRGRSDIQVNLI